MGTQSDHAVNDNSVQKLVPVVLQSVPHNNMGTQSHHAVNDNSVQKLVPVVLQSVPHNNMGTQSHHAVNDKGLGGPAVRLLPGEQQTRGSVPTFSDRVLPLT